MSLRVVDEAISYFKIKEIAARFNGSSRTSTPTVMTYILNASQTPHLFTITYYFLLRRRLCIAYTDNSELRTILCRVVNINLFYQTKTDCLQGYPAELRLKKGFRRSLLFNYCCIKFGISVKVVYSPVPPPGIMPRIFLILTISFISILPSPLTSAALQRASASPKQ